MEERLIEMMIASVDDDDVDRCALTLAARSPQDRGRAARMTKAVVRCRCRVFAHWLAPHFTRASASVAAKGEGREPSIEYGGLRRS